MQLEPLALILGSSVIAAVVSAWVTKSTSNRSLYLENITRERAKWRERLREIVSTYPFVAPEVQERFQIELVSRLNPYDVEDLGLIESVRRSTIGAAEKEEVSIRLSLLLKHDWERAKTEAASVFRGGLEVAARVTYSEYMRARAAIAIGDRLRFQTQIGELQRGKQQ
jgi:hypothetical protein